MLFLFIGLYLILVIVAVVGMIVGAVVVILVLGTLLLFGCGLVGNGWKKFATSRWEAGEDGWEWEKTKIENRVKRLVGTLQVAGGIFFFLLFGLVVYLLSSGNYGQFDIFLGF